MFRFYQREPVPSICQGRENRRLVAVSMNDANVVLVEYSGKPAGRSRQKHIAMRQDNGFNPELADLCCQLAFVK
jgi:hypothetical protein